MPSRPPMPVAAAHPGAALPGPNAAEVVLLQSVRARPAVSVLLSTTPAERMTRVDAARMDRLVDEAAARMDVECGAEARQQLAGALRHLAADSKGRRSRSAVALYAADGSSSAWSLPVPVVDRVVVDPTFATRDLVRALHRTPRYLVLVVTDREGRLFEGADDVLLPVPDPAFPVAADPRGRRRASRGRVRRGARGPAGDRPAVDADTFLRTVDAALSSYLDAHPAPFVVAGTGRTVAAFGRLTRCSRLLAGVLRGGHARTPLPTLAAGVRPVLEAYLRARQDDALALLDRRSDQGRVVTGMAAVWLATRAERPEMLVVDQDYFYPSRLSADGDLISPADDVDHPDVVDDAVDEVIEAVLQRGGWVALLEPGTLADRGHVALTLGRY